MASKDGRWMGINSDERKELLKRERILVWEDEIQHSW